MIEWFLSWLRTWQWGNVPGWLLIGPFALAYLVYRRDSREKTRKQVDDFSVRGKVDRKKLSIINVDKWYLATEIKIKNASNRPVTVVELGYAVHFEWFIQPEKGNYFRIDGKSIFWRLTDEELEPEEERTLNSPSLAVGTPPEGKDVFPYYGPRVIFDYIFLRDHSGRLWLIRPNSGKFPKLAKRRQFYWTQWKHPHPVHPLHTKRSIRVEGWFAALHGGRTWFPNYLQTVPASTKKDESGPAAEE